MSLARRAVLPFAALVLAACSSKDGGDSPQPPPAGFAARFELPKSGRPAFLQVPFPSDLNVGADGTIQIDAAGFERIAPKEKGARYIAESLARTRGFGVYGGAIFELTGDAPDLAKLPTGKPTDCQGKDAPIVFVDLDAGVTLPCQAAWNDDRKYNDLETIPTLVVRTARGVVVPEKHRVAVLLTSGITTAKGAALTASAELAALRDGQRADAAAKTYGDAIDAAVSKAGIDKSRVVSAAVYTTGPVTEELRQARELARATPLPTLRWGKDDVAPVAPAKFTSTTPLPDGWTATLDAYMGTPNKLPNGDDDPDASAATNPGIAHDSLSALGVAVFDAPNFLVEASGGYGVPEHGTFFHDASGKVAIDAAKPTSKIWVSFFVPKGTMPANGWPVVVYQHGLAGQRGDATAIANSLARRGFAVAAIEPVLQGTRGLDANARGDDSHDYKRKTSTYEGPDGFIDRNGEGSNYPPTDLFGNLFRLSSLRDQFRQSVIDHTTLLRVLKAGPTLDGLAEGGVIPKLDGSKVAYAGDSLGGILGSMVAGIEPDHAAYVLNVPGGALLTELAANSPNIYSLLNGAAALNFGLSGVQVPPYHPLAQLFQHVIDGGDPIAVAQTALKPIAIAGAMPKPRNVLMFEVLGDEIVSNHATEALAKAMGLPVAKPHGPLLADLTEVDGAAITNVPTMGATGTLIQVYPAQHGVNFYWKKGHRTYARQRPVFGGDNSTDIFPKLPKELEFDNPYLELQATALAFITEAFEGKTPTVTWTKAPAPFE